MKPTVSAPYDEPCRWPDFPLRDSTTCRNGSPYRPQLNLGLTLPPLKKQGRSGYFSLNFFTMLSRFLLDPSRYSKRIPCFCKSSRMMLSIRVYWLKMTVLCFPSIKVWSSSSIMSYRRISRFCLILGKDRRVAANLL